MKLHGSCFTFDSHTRRVAFIEGRIVSTRINARWFSDPKVVDKKVLDEIEMLNGIVSQKFDSCNMKETSSCHFSILQQIFIVGQMELQIKTIYS